MRIKFTEAAQYESEGPRQGPRFDKGEVVDARDDFGQRWVGRGKARRLRGGEETGDKLFVRVKDHKPHPDDEAEEAAELEARGRSGGDDGDDGDDGDAKPDRVERRGVYWYAMAGDKRLGAAMSKDAAVAFAAQHGLADPTKPSEA